MSKRKNVEHTICPTGKRSFEDEHDARKALGRARTEHFRGRDNRRGLVVESRAYECTACDGYHLTHQSRRNYESTIERGVVYA